MFVDLCVLVLIFLHTRLEIPFPFPLPGKRLNNPFAFLLIAIFLRGVVNPEWGEKGLHWLKGMITESSKRLLYFGALISGMVFLEIMHFLYSSTLFWNLNVEQGNGTYFATLLLFLAGLVTVIIYQEEGKDASKKENRWLWLPVTMVYFYLALDECMAIHEQFIMWFQHFKPDATIFHYVHEWLWVYVPIMLVVVVYFVRFFLWRFKSEPSIIIVLFIALSFWVSVFFYEGLAKNIIDPMGHGVLLIGMEEGSEMLGSILFMLGFSIYLQKSRQE